MSSTGELIDIERVTISSEGGRWKSTHRGNSLAVYPTSSPVLEQRWAGRLTHGLSQIERLSLTAPTARMRSWRCVRPARPICMGQFSLNASCKHKTEDLAATEVIAHAAVPRPWTRVDADYTARKADQAASRSVSAWSHSARWGGGIATVTRKACKPCAPGRSSKTRVSTSAVNSPTACRYAM